MNLVVGATGLLGGEICRQLRQAGKPVRALVRKSSDPAKVEALRRADVDTAVGDLRYPASLAAACSGVRSVISTASSTLSRQEGDTIETVDLQGQLNLVEAAKAEEVDHFVYISFPETPDRYPLQTAKRTVEARLRESGLTYTILQPTYFMEVWLSPALGFDPAAGKARIYGTGENKLSWISLVDVARFAVASLDRPAARNETFELGGPEALSPREVVSVFEEMAGRSFELERVAQAALKEQRAAAQNPLEQTFAALMLGYDRGQVIDNAPALKAMRLELTSVNDYARRCLGV